ncbi:MAG: ClbS/DfsB family four-helix bundle protein [Paracoccaceae bacterium]
MTQIKALHVNTAHPVGMPATSKTDLLDVLAKEHAMLIAVTAGIDARTALVKEEEETSINDVIAHRAHWIDLFFGWYADGQAGKTVHFLAVGYKWNELKRYNAALRERQKDIDWNAARAMFDEAHGQLTSFLNGCSNSELYDGPMQGARNAWTTGRWAEAAGPSHYRSASKYIRARLKALR